MTHTELPFTAAREYSYTKSLMAAELASHPDSCLMIAMPPIFGPHAIAPPFPEHFSISVFKAPICISHSAAALTPKYVVPSSDLHTSLPCIGVVVAVVVGVDDVVADVVAVDVVVVSVVVGVVLVVGVVVTVKVAVVLAVVVVVGVVVGLLVPVEVCVVVGVVRSQSANIPAAKSLAASFMTAATASHDALLPESAKKPPSKQVMLLFTRPRECSGTMAVNESTTKLPAHDSLSVSRLWPSNRVHSNVPAPSVHASRTELM